MDNQPVTVSPDQPNPVYQPPPPPEPAFSPPPSVMPPSLPPEEHQPPHHFEPFVPAPPPPGDPAAQPPFSQDDQPTAVVKALSVRGLEYGMMSLTLWLAAAALTIILLLLVNGQSNFTVLAFPISLLVVSLPVCSYFFLRLKRAEVATPALRFDPSKRRFSQITQLFTFLVSLISVIGIVYVIVAKIGGASTTPVGKTILNLAILLIISGGLFAYYWNDEHRQS